MNDNDTKSPNLFDDEIVTYNMHNFRPEVVVHPPVKADSVMHLVFTRPVRLKYISLAGEWIVHDFDAGFRTDGATVPELLWGVLPPWGTYFPAACLHDWYCQVAEYTGEYQYRRFGDEHFESWANQCGTDPVVSRAMGEAVIGYGKILKITGDLV